MGTVLIGLGALCYVAALIANIIILIEAFKDEIWKGVVGLLCGLYLLYYMLFELDHENKWVLVGIALGGGLLGAGLMSAGGGAMVPAAP
jgi:hypothetical protein